MVWHISNTTVRTPYRLRTALVALETSHLHGNLLGKANEQAFADLLHDQGLVHSARRQSSLTADHSDLGRKWRVALAQLGFVTYHFTRRQHHSVDQKLKGLINGIPDLTGRPYEITPAGKLLLDAEEIISQQEIFLRALSAYRIPSILESRYKHKQFSPLHFTLDVFQQLRIHDMEESISFEEMALFVQRSSADDGVDKVVDDIRTFRSTRESFDGPLRQFYYEAYEEAVLLDAPELANAPKNQDRVRKIRTRANTLRDYADLNFRYLKATGLFKSRRRGITVAPERTEVVQGLTAEPLAVLDDSSYLHQLWQGATLPTDDRQTAVTVIRSLEQTIQQKGAELEVIEDASLDDKQLQIARHQLEAQLKNLNEEEFADQQAERAEEILRLLKLILDNGRRSWADEDGISIPSGEMPAYFEWAIWRAFLAIDSLENKPWEARRFEIDQDMLPISHAPGYGPDMSFVFEEAIVVVEVTLTRSSRQEASEGEPVRRHVARYAENNTSDKTVFGLFIAPVVDTNTAHTFRSGDWYRSDDSKLNLHIVPMALADFRDLLRVILLNQKESANQLRKLLMECRMEANQDAPRWKKAISELVQYKVESLDG